MKNTRTIKNEDVVPYVQRAIEDAWAELRHTDPITMPIPGPWSKPSPLPTARLGRSSRAGLLRRLWDRITAKPLIHYCPRCSCVLDGQGHEMLRRYGARSYDVCIGRYKDAEVGIDICMHLRVGWS